MEELKVFTPRKPYLICVDSDGCAMDTMNIKHFRCFGPCMIQEWNLQPWQEAILARWNDINLYTMTRGISRFKGLAIALSEINKQYTPIEGVDELAAWAETAPELSNRAIKLAAAAAKGPCLAKALSWSQKVNAAIAALPEDAKQPFPHVREGLQAAGQFADVVVVSSANREAVIEEWEHCRLLSCVDVLCCQDTGSKADCIAALLAKGYAPNHVLMVGDAPGDRTAAQQNGVWFYPILVKQEGKSWIELAETALPRLQRGGFAAYAAQKAKEFTDNLMGS